MNYQFSSIFFLLFCFQTIVSQKLLSGKILVDGELTEKVNVLNATTNKTTLTNDLGEFTIPVSIGDALLFSAVNLETKRIIVY